jgi:hypothetical protein
MTTEPLVEARFRERIDALRAALDAAPAPARPEDRSGAGATGPQPAPDPAGTGESAS